MEQEPFIRSATLGWSKIQNGYCYRWLSLIVPPALPRLHRSLERPFQETACYGALSEGIELAEPPARIDRTRGLARYASRYSVRALDLQVDSSMLWVGAGLAVIAAVLLAFVPRLPSSGSAQGFSLASGGARVTGIANRKLRMFAVVQIAASFVLVAAARSFVKA